jgi:DNA sulfur modification protein DndD
MYFNSLTVDNFGVFNGRHNFNLELAQIGDSKRPFVIIRGHNGAGKSTLFQAMALALHGSLALGTRVSQREYNDFLMARFHRHSEKGGLYISDTSRVILSCSLTISGEPVRLQVERRWQRRGENVDETLLILENGQPPDIPASDYQTWVNDLIPPGFNPVIFFDTEQLDTLASPEQYETLLGEILRRLLGLDLVERLQRDLDYYERRTGGSHRLGQLREAVLQKQAKLDKTNKQLANKQEEAQTLTTKLKDLQAELNKLERQLASEGGTFAARRATLQERHRLLEREIEEVSEQLRSLAAELLPFTLVPELSVRLSHKLRKEAERQQEQAAEKLWQERVAAAEKEMESNSFWEELNVPPDVRTTVAKRLLGLLREEQAAYVTATTLLHHLAQPEQEKLQSWIRIALEDLPVRVQQLSDKLRELKEERRQITTDLRRAPDDELLAPLYAEIEHVEEKIKIVASEQTTLDEEIGATKFQQELEEKERDQAAQTLQEAQSEERQLELAAKSKFVLQNYQDILTQRRLGKLGEYLVKNFNAVCRKEHLLSEANIDLESFKVTLTGVNGHKLGVGDFSAGESQLYVLALLQALRHVSKRELPLIIDTPLARLDETHRERLMAHYLPNISKQVILFATDSEANDGLVKQALAHTARLYQLRYDESAQQTTTEVIEANAVSNLISPNGIGIVNIRETVHVT